MVIREPPTFGSSSWIATTQSHHPSSTRSFLLVICHFDSSYCVYVYIRYGSAEEEALKRKRSAQAGNITRILSKCLTSLIHRNSTSVSCSIRSLPSNHRTLPIGRFTRPYLTTLRTKQTSTKKLQLLNTRRCTGKDIVAPE